MANLKDIRTRIKTVTSIQQVTRAMKMVAAAKLRRAQQNMEQARPYAGKINGILKNLLPSMDRKYHPLLSIRESDKTGFIIVTADRGLCGSFNTNIVRRAHQIVDEIGKENVSLICIGRKGRDYFKKREYNVVDSYTDFWSELNFNDAMKITNAVTSRYLEGEFDQIRVIFNEFKNVAQQNILEFNYLPLILDDGDEMDTSDYLIEPSMEEVIHSLVPRHLTVQMWRFLLESNASEQGARMTAMENATENAGEMISNLTLEYNKARQSAITNEILEVVSGAEALVQ